MALIHKIESERIIGAAITVHKTIGAGLREKTYERALVQEFLFLGVPHIVQPQYDVIYRDVKIDTFIPDLVACEKVVVDTKTIKEIGDIELAQMMGYLKQTRLQLGLIINFSKPQIDIRRVIL